MLDKVEVLKDNGEKILYDEISMFEVSISLTPKRYAVLTSNELDPNGLIKLLVAEIVGNRLVKITDDTEWATIKNVMRSVISNSSYDFNYINVDNKFVSAGDVFRIIAVQESAKTQLISDYSAKKPQKEVVKNEQEPKKEEPLVDPSIYPTSDSNTNIGAEIIPGIMETNNVITDALPPDTAPLEEINIPTTPDTDNIVNDIPSNDVPVIDIPGISMPQNNVDTVASGVVQQDNSVPVPDNNVINVDNTSTSSSASLENNLNVEVPGATAPATTNISTVTPDDEAKKELIDTILSAVNKYLSQVKTSDDGSAGEVVRLKQELKSMEEKLNSIMSLINK